MQKILIITPNKFHKYTGGGVVLSNLFHELADEDIYLLHRDTIQLEEEFKNSNFIKWFWLRPQIVDLISIFMICIKEIIINRKKISLSSFKDLLIQTSYFSLNSSRLNSVKNFNPDEIYGWASDSLWADSILKISKQLKIPYVIHFMDNQVGVHHEDLLDKILNSRFNKKLDTLVTNANAVFVISEMMSKEYSHKWGCKCEVFRGSIDGSNWPDPSSTFQQSNKKKIITYVGSVEKHQVNALLDIIECVEELNDLNESISLNLYLNEKDKMLVNEKLSTMKSVQFFKHPEFNMLRDTLIKSDILISFYSFDQSSFDYYKLSFATKIVPFMLSGRPILIYGPKGINPVEYAKSGNWAEVVDNQSIKSLKLSIKKLLDDQDFSLKISSQARHIALKDHDLMINSQRFLKSMELASLN